MLAFKMGMSLPVDKPFNTPVQRKFKDKGHTGVLLMGQAPDLATGKTNNLSSPTIYRGPAVATRLIDSDCSVMAHQFSPLLFSDAMHGLQHNVVERKKWSSHGNEIDGCGKDQAVSTH